jgi:hypothetical protein
MSDTANSPKIVIACSSCRVHRLRRPLVCLCNYEEFCDTSPRNRVVAKLRTKVNDSFYRGFTITISKVNSVLLHIKW